MTQVTFLTSADPVQTASKTIEIQLVKVLLIEP
jgi:hypothetical protein